MKNLKKVVALVLAFAMVLSMGTVAFAAENATEADALYSVGLFKGYSATEKVLGLDDAANAYQAIVLIGRALGWTTDAEATVDFTDVPDYAVPFVAKAVELGITNGVSVTEFGASVDGKRMVTWTLRALGYDMADAWDNTDTHAATAGITVPTGEVLRDSVVGVIYQTLMTSKVGSTTTVLDDLIAAGTVTEADAVAAGLKAAAPTTLEVVSVTATNLKEIIVKFNKEVDTKTVLDANFVVKKGSVSKAIDASLASDKMTVTLKAEAAANFDNQSDYTVAIEKVKDLDGKEITKVTKTVSVFDGSLPEVSAITVTGPKSLELTFTEPVKEGGKVTIKSGTTSIGVNNTYSYGKNTVTVNLFSSLTDGTVYTVSTSEFKDYAGYTMINNSQALAYAKDTADITATVTKATQKYVVVEFSKPVKNLANTYFYHTFSAWTAKGVYTDEALTTPIVSSNAYSKVYVKFADTASGTDHPLQAGTTMLTILNKVGSTEVKDNWDNVYAGQTIAVEVSADVTAPVVTELKVDTESALKIKFDEDVEFTSSNVKVYDPDGKSVTVTVSGSGKEYTIALDKSYSGKTLKVEIKDVKDTSLQGNKLTLHTEDLSVTDKTAPTVSKVTKKYIVDGEQSLYVFFNEAVSDTALVNANYYLEKAGSYKALEDTIEFYDGNKIVKITLKAAEKGYVEDSYNLIVRNVQDANGNAMIGQTVATGDIKAFDDNSNKATVTKAEVTAKDTIVITFDQLLTTVEATAFTIEGAAPSGMEIGTNSDGNTVVTLKVTSGAIAADLSNKASYTVAISATDTTLANVFGVAAANVADVDAADTYVDKFAPSVVENGYTTYDADSDGKIDHIKVDFDEDLYVATISMDKFTVAGYEVLDAYLDSVATPGTSATVRAGAGADASVVWITVKEKDAFDGAATPKVSIAAGIKDNSADKNAFAAVSDKDSKDKVAPLLVSVEVTTDGATAGFANDAATDEVVTLTFTEAVKISDTDATAVTALEKFTIAGGATDGGNFLAGVVSNNTTTPSKVITVTINGVGTNAFATDADDTIDGVAGDFAADEIEDVAGNDYADTVTGSPLTIGQ